METFTEFAWPCYCIVPGLRAACVAFLAEPVVRTAELELRTYWSGYREARRDPKAQPVGSCEGRERLLAQGIDRVAPADTRFVQVMRSCGEPPSRQGACRSRRRG